MNYRTKKYAPLAKILESFSDIELVSRLKNATPLHSSIGGESFRLVLEETPIFVKKIPLTHFELKDKNYRSTANIFNLPLFYQYGVGSTGFGAWRELAANEIVTKWVLEDKCPNFPLLFHWRVLKSTNKENRPAIDIVKTTNYWENSEPIRKRLEELNSASTHLILFSEYFPMTLHKWLSEQLSESEKNIAPALEMIDKNLQTAIACMNSQGFTHFDLHLYNIITDGTRLYLSDLGLALSEEFKLSKSEQEFLKQHLSYDSSSSSASFMHTVFSALFGKDRWLDDLAKTLEGKNSNLPSPVERVAKKHGPVALIMNNFFEELQHKSKLTSYPQRQIEKIINLAKKL